MRHLMLAIEFTLAVAAFTAVMWILLGYAHHGHDRIRMMLNSRYGWRDSGVLLARKTRREYGPTPGKHRATDKAPRRPQPPPVTLVAISAPEPRPVMGDPLTVEEAPWPPITADDGPRTMTMTQPVYRP